MHSAASSPKGAEPPVAIGEAGVTKRVLPEGQESDRPVAVATRLHDPIAREVLGPE